MELLSAEQRKFYSKYFLCAIGVGVAVFLFMKFALGVTDDYFISLYPDVKVLLCFNIFLALFLSERKNRMVICFSRVFVLANFSLFGFFTGCAVRYLSVMSK
ncbi:hypothetical protein [Pseudomonas antarctica]|uniref:hypothetical protein n=1 Tax=Pseudomonas antarctica TaxID=219572 RepID=UPI00387B2B8F